MATPIIPVLELPDTLRDKLLSNSKLEVLSAHEAAIYHSIKYYEKNPHQKNKKPNMEGVGVTFSSASPRLLESERLQKLEPQFLQWKKQAASEDVLGAAEPRGVAAPITNRGGKVPSIAHFERMQLETVRKGGRPVLVSIPKPDKGMSVRHSFVDYVNFTFNKYFLNLVGQDGHIALDDHDYICAFSPILENIFGYGVTFKRESGLNFYKDSYDLGINGWGTVCIGGQRDTVLVTLKGQGLLAAKPEWETRLHKFLSSVDGAKLTRVDLASDNFNSKTNLDDYLNMYHAGLFTLRVPPEIQCVGNWIKPNGKGRTLYIGTRTSGKLLRIYEKGLQLANGFHEKFPNWVRVELELKNIDRVIPFDVLLKPGQYLAGAYPALQSIHRVQNVVKTYKNTVKSTFERSLQTTRHQFGKHIWSAVQILGLEQAIDILTKGKEEFPRMLELSDYRAFDTSLNLRANPVYHTGVIPL